MDPSEWEQVGSVRDADTNGVMVSNLPLLFANSEPCSLQTMTQRQLERFVSFMVRCSVGANLHTPWHKLPRPPWWPQRLPFKAMTGVTPTPSHRSMLQRLVERCYQYHGCEFLLQFCRSLVQHKPPQGYSFTDNKDGTTAMHHSVTGKLLVTFRNENREYDKLTSQNQASSRLSSSGSSSSRPQLLPRRTAPTTAVVRQDVEDVYLCERCGSEFVSLALVQDHERGGCCESPPPEGVGPPSGGGRLASPEPELVLMGEPTDQVAHMHQLGLVPAGHTGVAPHASPTKRAPTDSPGHLRGGVGGRVHYAVRKVARSNCFRYEAVDVCSPLGRVLRRQGGRATPSGGAGGLPAQQLVLRYERHLPAAPHLLFAPLRDTQRGLTRWVTVYRAGRQPWHHSYSFNKAQRCDRWLAIETGLDLRARLLHHTMKPLRVVLRRVPKRVIDRYSRLGDPQKTTLYIDLTGDEGNTSVVVPRGLARNSTPSSEGTMPLGDILQMVTGNCNWVTAPGFMEHVIAGGAVPDNVVAVTLQKLFSPSGLLVKLLSKAVQSMNLGARAMEEYGTAQPSPHQQNALLVKYGVLQEVAYDLGASDLMINLMLHHGKTLNNAQEMVRLTTLPPGIPRVSNPAVGSVLASASSERSLLQRSHQSHLINRHHKLSPHSALVTRKPGPKSRRRGPYDGCGDAAEQSNNNHGFQSSLGNSASADRISELRGLTPKNLSDDVLASRLKDVIKKTLQDKSSFSQPGGGSDKVFKQQSGLPGVPTPQPGGPNLPEPRPGITGLSEPQRDGARLPEPQSGITRLSTPQPGDGRFSKLQQRFSAPQPVISRFSEPQPGIVKYSEPQPGVTKCPDPQPDVKKFSEPQPGITKYPELQPNTAGFSDHQPGNGGFLEPNHSLQPTTGNNNTGFSSINCDRTQAFGHPRAPNCEFLPPEKSNPCRPHTTVHGNGMSIIDVIDISSDDEIEALNSPKSNVAFRNRPERLRELAPRENRLPTVPNLLSASNNNSLTVTNSSNSKMTPSASSSLPKHSSSSSNSSNGNHKRCVIVPSPSLPNHPPSVHRATSLRQPINEFSPKNEYSHWSQPFPRHPMGEHPVALVTNGDTEPNSLSKFPNRNQEPVRRMTRAVFTHQCAQENNESNYPPYSTDIDTSRVGSTQLSNGHLTSHSRPNVAKNFSFSTENFANKPQEPVSQRRRLGETLLNSAAQEPVSQRNRLGENLLNSAAQELVSQRNRLGETLLNSAAQEPLSERRPLGDADVITEEEERFNLESSRQRDLNKRVVITHIKTSLVPFVVPSLLNNNHGCASLCPKLCNGYDWDESKLLQNKKTSKRLLSGYDSEHELEKVVSPQDCSMPTMKSKKRGLDRSEPEEIPSKVLRREGKGHTKSRVKNRLSCRVCHSTKANCNGQPESDSSSGHNAVRMSEIELGAHLGPSASLSSRQSSHDFNLGLDSSQTSSLGRNVNSNHDSGSGLRVVIDSEVSFSLPLVDEESLLSLTERSRLSDSDVPLQQGSRAQNVPVTSDALMEEAVFNRPVAPDSTLSSEEHVLPITGGLFTTALNKGISLVRKLISGVSLASQPTGGLQVGEVRNSESIGMNGSRKIGESRGTEPSRIDQSLRMNGSREIGEFKGVESSRTDQSTEIGESRNIQPSRINESNEIDPNRMAQSKGIESIRMDDSRRLDQVNLSSKENKDSGTADDMSDCSSGSWSYVSADDMETDSDDEMESFNRSRIPLKREMDACMLDECKELRGFERLLAVPSHSRGRLTRKAFAKMSKTRCSNPRKLLRSRLKSMNRAPWKKRKKLKRGHKSTFYSGVTRIRNSSSNEKPKEVVSGDDFTHIEGRSAGLVASDQLEELSQKLSRSILSCITDGPLTEAFETSVALNCSRVFSLDDGDEGSPRTECSFTEAPHLPHSHLDRLKEEDWSESKHIVGETSPVRQSLRIRSFSSGSNRKRGERSRGHVARSLRRRRSKKRYFKSRNRSPWRPSDSSSDSASDGDSSGSYSTVSASSRSASPDSFNFSQAGSVSRSLNKSMASRLGTPTSMSAIPSSSQAGISFGTRRTRRRHHLPDSDSNSSNENEIFVQKTIKPPRTSRKKRPHSRATSMMPKGSSLITVNQLLPKRTVGIREESSSSSTYSFNAAPRTNKIDIPKFRSVEVRLQRLKHHTRTSTTQEKAKLRKNRSTKRMLANLVIDECKEFERTGYHPREALRLGAENHDFKNDLRHKMAKPEDSKPRCMDHSSSSSDEEKKIRQGFTAPSETVSWESKRFENAGSIPSDRLSERDEGPIGSTGSPLSSTHVPHPCTSTTSALTTERKGVPEPRKRQVAFKRTRAPFKRTQRDRRETSTSDKDKEQTSPDTKGSAQSTKSSVVNENVLYSSPVSCDKELTLKEDKQKLAKTKKIPNELKMLLSDECKEFSQFGFHPKDVISKIKCLPSSGSEEERSPARQEDDARKTAKGYETDTEMSDNDSKRSQSRKKKKVPLELRNLFIDEYKEFKSWKSDAPKPRLLPRRPPAKDRLEPRGGGKAPKINTSFEVGDRPSPSRRPRLAKVASGGGGVSSEDSDVGTSPSGGMRSVLRRGGGMCAVAYALPSIC